MPASQAEQPLINAASALSPPVLLTEAQLQRLSPAALAYLGDAVYELYVRLCFLYPPKKAQLYHRQVVDHVCAESQANRLRSLESHLTPLEQEILRRGRNASSKRHKRIDPDVYQQASSLETLIGYLYLSDPQRLLQLLTIIQTAIAQADR
ncbi:MAG: ribonuclease III [Leptolyngbyaceae cyanobacterium SL_7_1]|nr:ribonuclease III [Leptolyngbyaceae cyanobacterium SL_7_1]